VFVHSFQEKDYEQKPLFLISLITKLIPTKNILLAIGVLLKKERSVQECAHLIPPGGREKEHRFAAPRTTAVPKNPELKKLPNICFFICLVASIYMELPLEKKVRRRAHREMGTLQDNIVELIYSLEPEAVLHGGTSIWRCYHAPRFSEDLDFYFKPRKDFKKSLKRKLELYNFQLQKYKQTSNTIYSKIQKEQTIVSLEIALRKYSKPVIGEYEKMNGTKTDILTLSPNDLLLEKIHAYKNRKLIRDVFDIYFLLPKTTNTPAVKKEIRLLVNDFPKPADEKNLPSLILTGITPSLEQMKQKIRQSAFQ
jgi:predicted nucleotidyltransferase component of viral defense system